jgi:hypothetical protein
MNERNNILKAVRFDQPDYIPMEFHINASCWNHYDQHALQELMAAHPLLFPDFQWQEKVKPHYGLTQRKDAPYTDPWGCVWTTTDDGITGSVHGHPLASWDDLEAYTPPDPAVTDGTLPITWPDIKAAEQCKADCNLFEGGLPHGHTFLRLQDIRGYENLIFDMMDNEPRLSKLIEMVEAFNYEVVTRWLRLKPDMLRYPEDLGMQVGPMLSPENFRTFIKPVYQRLMKPARDQGCIVHMHSDGDIRTLIDDLVDGGVEVINLQDLVNGIDWIAERFAGRVCIDLDIDRQEITARGTPDQIDALIREEVTKLGSKAGGLMMIYGLYPGIPMENVAALMDAMERYAGYYA